MISLTDYISQSMYFEEVVVELLKRACPGTLNEKEYVRLHHPNAQSWYADAYLPDASLFFNDGGDCFVEVKTQLRSDTLYRVRHQYDQIIQESPCHKLVLIYRDSLIPVPTANKLQHMIGRDIKLVSYKELEQVVAVDNVLEHVALPYEGGLTNDNRCILVRNAFLKGNVCLFLGAGVGKSAGMPNWQELLVKILKTSNAPSVVDNVRQYHNLEEDCMYSYPIIGRFAVDGLVPQDDDNSASELYETAIEELRNKIKRRLYSKPHGSRLVDVLATLTMSEYVDSVVTYNYDDLIENKLKEIGFSKIMPIYENNRCLPIEKPIYHVHGYVPRDKSLQSKPILSERDYHELYKEAFHWTNVEQLHALNRNTCIFIGLSMTDPNLRRLLDFSRGALLDDGKENPHFLFMCKDCHQKTDDKKDAYFKRFEQIMHEFGITVIWYDNHNELPDLLLALLP
ncbi:MAG: SIR2 family protein [Prevotellaceae bacterium]|nr:SIR2 family protein [Candidatus Colivivens equi]